MQDHPGIDSMYTGTEYAGEKLTGLPPHDPGGKVLYWASFLALLGIEFYIGGLLSRILSRENYSIYVSVFNTLPFYNVLVNAGLAYSITYLVASAPGQAYPLLRQSMQTQSAWYLLLSALHMAAFALYPSPLTASLLITILISYAYAGKLTLTSFFLARGEHRKAALANVLQKAVLAAALTIAAWQGALTGLLHGGMLHTYPALELLVFALYGIVFFRTGRETLQAGRTGYRSRLLKFGRYAMTNNALNVLYYTLFAVMLRASALTLHQQVMLGMSVMFFRYTAVAIGPVFSILSPQLTAIKREPGKVWAVYRTYLARTMGAGVLVGLGCLLLFGYAVGSFYDAAYHDLPQYFRYFCYLVPILFLNSLNGSVLAALGKIKFTTGVEIACTAVLLLFLVSNLLTPATDHKWFYLVVTTHIILKAALLSFGILRSQKQAYARQQ